MDERMAPMTTIVAMFGSIVGLCLIPVVRFYTFRLRLRLKRKLPNTAKALEQSGGGGPASARTLAARYRSKAAAARRRAVKLEKRKLNEVAEKYETLARCVEEMVDRPRPNPTDKQSW